MGLMMTEWVYRRCKWLEFFDESNQVFDPVNTDNEDMVHKLQESSRLLRIMEKASPVYRHLLKYCPLRFSFMGAPIPATL